MLYLKGQFVPDEAGVIPVTDRGFLYGDGLFETVLARHGRLFRWTDHWHRLSAGAAALRIELPAESALRESAHQLLHFNQVSTALVRVTISRGVGHRGYSPRGAMTPTVVITTHEFPRVPAGPDTAWHLVTARMRLPKGDPLAGYKTANKLHQVIARAEADDAGVHDALLLNSAGEIAESTSANVFFHRGNTLVTPPLDSGILPGVTRRAVVDLASSLGIATREETLTPADLVTMEGAFLTLTSLGIVPVERIDGWNLPLHPITRELSRHYEELVDRETRLEGR